MYKKKTKSGELYKIDSKGQWIEWVDGSLCCNGVCSTNSEDQQIEIAYVSKQKYDEVVIVTVNEKEKK